MTEFLLILGGFILLYALIELSSRILHSLEVRRNQKQARDGVRPLIEGRERGKAETPPRKPRPTAPPPSNCRPPNQGDQ